MIEQPTASRVRELFVYEPETGIFLWRVKSKGKYRGGGRWVQPGDIAGARSKMKNLGRFASEEDARSAYIKAAQSVFGDFARYT